MRPILVFKSHRVLLATQRRTHCLMKSLTSVRSFKAASVPGTVGIPQLCAIFRAAVLFPIISIASLGGPTTGKAPINLPRHLWVLASRCLQVIPAFWTAAAKKAFSDRKPYPG